MSLEEIQRQLREQSTEPVSIQSSNINVPITSIPLSSVPDIQTRYGSVFSPIQTRSKTRQTGLSTLLTQTGPHVIYTTPTYACVPVDSTTKQPQTVPTATTVTETADFAEENADRRYVYVGPQTQTTDNEDTMVRLRAEILRLRNKYERNTIVTQENSPSHVTLQSVPSSIVQQEVSSDQQRAVEPKFPKPNLRVYSEYEKLRGRENFVAWRRMLLRDLRMMNLAPFIETELGTNTTWSELSRIHGDALAQRSILSSVSSLIEAQIQFYTTAKQMWTYITESYSDLAQIQFLSVLAEVDMVTLQPGTSVHEVFDKLMALRSAAVELGEDMPEKYWTTQATKIVCDVYPRETFEALQQTPTTLASMRRHFRNMVRDSPFGSTHMFAYTDTSSGALPTTNYQPPFPNTPLKMRMYSVAQSRKNFPHKFKSTPVHNLPILERHQAAIESGPVQSITTHNQQQQHALPAPVKFPHRPENWKTATFVEQPRFPPPGSYIQTTGPPGKKICYSCGISGHGAEFCPNMNMPVCYGCKEIGHKRPQCTKPWAWDDAGVRKQQPHQQVASTTVASQSQQTSQEIVPVVAGTFLTFNSTTLPKSGETSFVLDTGATHHVVNDVTLLVDFTPNAYTQTVFLADNIRSLSILGKGMLSLTISNPPNKLEHLNLTQVLVCPSITVNIISVRQLCRENCVSVLFSDISASIFRQSNELETLNSQVTPNISSKEQLIQENITSCDLLFPSIENFPSSSSSKYKFLFAILQVKELYMFVAHFRYFPNKIFLTESLNRTTYHQEPGILLNIVARIPPKICQDNSNKQGNLPVGKGKNSISPNIEQHKRKEAIGLETYTQKRTDSPQSLKEEVFSDSEGDTELYPTEGDDNDLQQDQPKRLDKGNQIRQYTTKTGKIKVKNEINIPRNCSMEEYVTIWHRRLGHISLPALTKFFRLHGLRFSEKTLRMGNCSVCALTKLTEKTYDQKRVTARRPGEITSADLIGPISPTTFPHRCRFLLTIIDHYTRYVRVFSLKKKSETSKCLQAYFDSVRRQFPGPGQLGVLRTDQGKEFTNVIVKRLVQEYGMVHQITEPFVSQHNGLVERVNRTIEERTRSLLTDSGFPLTFWNIAADAAEYVYNRTPHSAIENKTPFEMWFGHTDNIRHLVMFGSRAYALQLKKKRSEKFHPVAKPQYICGYTSTGYLLFDPETKKIEMSCNVKVEEKFMYRHDYPQSSSARTPPFCFGSCSESAVTGQSQNNQLNDESQMESLQITTQTEEPFYSNKTVSQCSIEEAAVGTPVSVIELELSQDIPLSPVQTVDLGASSSSSEKQKNKRLKRKNKAQGNQLRKYSKYNKVKIRNGSEIDASESSSDPETQTETEEENIIEIELSQDVPWSPKDDKTSCKMEGIVPDEQQNIEFPVEQSHLKALETDKLQLRVLRIPDKVNKLDDFMTPHPEAPKSYAQMIKREDRDKWLLATQQEIRSMTDLGVWEVIKKNEVPRGHKLLPWNWVFTFKNNYSPKARLVVVGSRDENNYGNSETYSPVPSPSVIRWFCATALQHKLRLRQLDVKTAFLNSPLPYEKYTLIPEGVNLNRTHYALKLRKAAYGLAVSPLLWYTTLSDVLLQCGLQRSFREPCLFYLKTERSMLLVLVYVDDILVATDSVESSMDVIHQLQQNFTVTVIQHPKVYVGFQLDYDPENNTLRVHQKEYAEEIVKTFLPLAEMFPKRVPMNLYGNFPKVPKSEQPVHSVTPYKSVLGSIYYLANMTRPDILFATNYLSRSQSAPTRLHFKLLTVLLRYIYSTSEMGLNFGSSKSGLEAFIDADFGSDFPVQLTGEVDKYSNVQFEQRQYEKFKSTTGCLVALYGNPISWICRKQTLLTTSTTEAEYIAVADSSSQILFLYQLTCELFPSSITSVSIHEDNLSTTKLLQSVYNHGKLKHLILKYLKVKELIWSGVFKMVRVSSKDQLADILTKPLQVDRFEPLRDRILRRQQNCIHGSPSSACSCVGPNIASLTSYEA